MKIVHKAGNSRTAKDARAGYMLSNSNGYYLKGIESRYAGLFFWINSGMFRLLDNIDFDFRHGSIVCRGQEVELQGRTNKANLFIPQGCNAMVCSLQKEAAAEFYFDVRGSYDLRKWGKQYRIYEEDGLILVEFVKKTDSTEDDTHDEIEYKRYMVISGDGLKYKIMDEWVKKDYSYDRERNSHPFEWHVFHGLHLVAKDFVIAAGKDKAETKKEAAKVRKNIARLRKKPAVPDIRKKELRYACMHAAKNVNDLSSENGIFAGLPWFFQYWTRDEAISLKSVMLLGNRKQAKSILMRQLMSLGKRGRIPNRLPGTDTGSADATGWMFLRCSEMINDFAGKDKFFQGLVKGQVEKSLKHQYEHYTDDNRFAVNKPQETWMDSVWGGDDRAGARIEIQALRLFMYKLAYELSGKKVFHDLGAELRDKVRKNFWNSRYLADGLGDWTIRPNVFIAAYVFPELLTQDEWKKCIRTVLSRLWLRWGGLATIDKKSSLYCSRHTGEAPQSYHRGDSWFWLNNLAAIVMARIDRKYFRKYIDRIVEASTRDILYNGAAGCHSELSSASKQRGEGCVCQAWSSAMFIELLHELYGKKIKA